MLMFGMHEKIVLWYIDVSFGERGRKIHRDPAGNQTRDLPITSQTLLPMSHWTQAVYPTVRERKTAGVG